MESQKVKKTYHPLDTGFSIRKLFRQGTFKKIPIESLVVPLLFILLWEIHANKINNPIILPSFSSVLAIIINPTESILGIGSLANNLFISFIRVLIGYTVAVLIAVPIGLIMGYNKLSYNLLSNFIGLFRPIPPLAWVPLVLAWFGVKSMTIFYPLDTGTVYLYLRNIRLSMVFIIFIGAFFPILTSTIYGVKNARKSLIDAARTLGAKEYQVIQKIIIPSAAPSIVNGLRIGLGVAWMCLVSAEMLPGSIAGVGYMITHAYVLARTDVVVCGMITIGAVGVLLDFFFRLLESKKFRWQKHIN
jgi:NitT/TauT family transport system permease protein